MASHSAFLRLPREIRNEIYISLFSGLIFDRNNPHNCWYVKDQKRGLHPQLALLHVCRQVYAEASPLVLRHVRVCCMDAKDMLHFLVALDPEQIRQLKYLNVCYSIFCIRLPPVEAEDPDPDSEQDNGIRGFHVGALLGLFPSLQLDMLELEDGMSEGLERYEACHGADLIESLLHADGFREVRASVRAGDDAFVGRWMIEGTSGWLKEPEDYIPRWEEPIRTRFRGRPGWSVELYVNEERCPDEHWEQFRKAGFTLLDGLEDRNELGAEVCENPCLVAGDYWNFRACRGEGPIAVTQEDDRMLGCIGDWFQEGGPLSDEEVNRASDSLKDLFRGSDWAKIDQAVAEADQGADGPYDCHFW